MFNNEKIIETKTCKHCQSSFEITDKDLEFYQKVSPSFGGKKYNIPPPTLCPDCRYQLVLSSRNERNLYKRTCDATGKPIISIYSPDKPYKVYSQDIWWSDNWNALGYGKDFDFSKTFFEQFGELFKNVPKVNLNSPLSHNSEYTNQSQCLKNCYMMFCSGESEECFYGMWYERCKYCVDCLYIEDSEYCYELINCINCYKCFFSKNLLSCRDVYFSSNLNNCQNCIGCVNLDNKQYYIFNKESSKEEFEQYLENIKTKGSSFIGDLHKKTYGFFQNFPKKYYNGRQNENCFGDYLQNNKNAYFGFNCRDNEDTKYCKDTWVSKISYDLIEILQVDYSLLVEGTAFANHCLFTAKSNTVSEVYYSSHCNFSDHLFGCVGLKNKSYCILNKQYTKEEYEMLVPRIIEHMMKTQEWGEFFPSSISPFGYNETVAQEYFPISRDKALPYLYKWSDYEPPFPKVDKIIPANKLPENISDIPDDILNRAIECEITKRPFRIIKQELDFYRKNNLPIPKRHPDQRHLDRMKLRNPRKLFDRKCDKCGKYIKTTYSPDRKEIVYCEECYNKEIC
ncbi:MAG: hypothetical protein PHE25_03220 [Candidatus Gracilibacteria bacterium]|nr:hypothetical protein [Candidatus Gracilibacteria bacterium]